jgi:predicted permease
VPLRGASVTTIVLEGQTFDRYSGGYLAVNSSVSQDYFRVMGMTVLKGRTFTPEDTAKSAIFAGVIDENMARDLFADRDPLGQAFLLDEGRIRVQVVGVVNHIRHLSYEADEQSTVKYQFYTCLQQIPDEFVPALLAGLNLIVRTDHDPANLVAAVRSQVSAIDGDQLVFNARTMGEIIAGSIAQRRFLMLLLALFAGVAITLAVVGIYGVISYSVLQRTQEIGIRLALGATTKDVLRIVMRQGLRLVLGGIAVGLLAAFALTRLMTTLLYGVSATDATTFVGVPLIVAGVALVACFVPARRAANVDPLVALRHE